MADGNLARQSNVGKDSVVFGPTVYDVPLLPFEKELIKTIGLTEDEYRKFAGEVRRRGGVRPAEYAHIPDVQAIGTETLIMIAVSLVLTGVSYLLTPKPKMPEASKRTQLDLGSINAANRFTPSRGFDTLNELADYGSPIPIIFGLYDKGKDIGGMLVTPKLVWSRMFSHGTQQSAKLLFAVGEQGHADGIAPDGILRPDLEGIYLGNNALDALYEDFFAFYWKRNSPISQLVPTASGFNRIQLQNLQYGTAGEPSSGDPGTYNGPNDDVFLCPDNQSNRSTSFCHAFSPVNNTQFGVFGPIANGNGYRVNYEVVSIPDGTDNKQAFVLTLRRIKIVGALGEDVTGRSIDKDKMKEVRKQDMEGEGRQYSPRMGLTSLKKVTGSTESVQSATGLSETQRVQEGDIVEFTIVPTKIDEDKYQRSNNRGGENVDDINSTVASEQIAADEAMQIGEQFAIANTKWVVVGRTLERFDPEIDETQKIRLKCIDNNESRQQVIGLVSEQNVVNPAKGFISDEGGIGAGFFPITRVATGIVRNNKPAVVTEVGIRSKVFQRLNNLCAFNTVPTPGELDDFDDEEVTVRSGTYTGTIMRSSVFQVFVREAGLDSNNNPFRFQRIDLYFVVRGSRPVDQYNFIRFTHPGGQPKELEYKFVGIPGSELRAISDEQIMIHLFASVPDTKQEIVQENIDVPGLGSFEVEAAGYRVKKRDVRLNKEFLRKPSTSLTNGLSTIPSAVKREDVLPQEQSGTFRRAISMEFVENLGNLDPPGRAGAFFSAIFGDADNFAVGSEHSKEQWEVIGDKWIRVNWRVRVRALPAGHYALTNGAQNTYDSIGADIVGSSPGFSIGERVSFKRGLGSTLAQGSTSAYPDNNKFKNNHPSGSSITFSGYTYRISNINTTSAPEGRSGAYYYELFGDASNLAIGDIRTTTRSMTSGSKQLKIEITGVVTSLPSGHFTGLKQRWEQLELVVVDDGFTNSNWDKGDVVDDTVGLGAGNNPFYWTYDRVGFKYKINDLREAPQVVNLSGETEFESQSQYADISFYRGLVQKSNESEPEHNIVYVNEILPNNGTPEYGGLTLAGLSLKASRNFTSLDQMRCWLGSGLNVYRLHPDYASVQNNPYEDSSSLTFQQRSGPSNLFTDLVFYLLTNQTGGAGTLTGMSATNPFLLNQSDFEETSRFLHKQELFFNGVIAERTNLRQYITDTAPYFLCNFVIMDGKFSLLPAIPHNPLSGAINLGPVVIDQLFTAGNILEDTYKVEYLRSEERKSFKAVMRYRFESRNKLPEERVMEVTLNSQTNTGIPEEQFDLTQFCTSRDHAVKVAQYFLGIRKLVTHTISFSTTVEGLNLRAGSYIKVITEASPYSSANNGTVSTTGAVTSASDLADGTYDVTYFKTGSDDVADGQMQVSGGRVADSTFYDSVFTIRDATVSQNIYVVEQLTFSQEGTVDIVASEHPCDSNEVSELAKLVANPNSVNVQDT
jgi:hypothetical protein